jgi:hypothetical protein
MRKLRKRIGFLLLPPLWVIMVELGVTFATGAAIFYDMATGKITDAVCPDCRRVNPREVWY